MSTLPSRVAETASRMTMKWEVKRDNKAPSPTLAIEVCIPVLETQSFAFDQRVTQRPSIGPPSISPTGEKSAGISIRSPLIREIRRQMSCGLVAVWLHFRLRL